MKLSLLRTFSFLAILALINFYLLPLDTFACSAARHDPITLSISTDPPMVRTFNGGLPEETDPVLISNCARTSEFLMVAFGPDHLKITGLMKDVAFNVVLLDDRCRVDNSPFPSAQPFSERAAAYQEQIRFLDTCITLRLTDMTQPNIVLAPNQKGCKVHKQNGNSVEFGTGFCFVKPQQGSTYFLNASVRPECLDRTFINRNNLVPMQVPGTIGIYLAGDASGSSTQLSQIFNGTVDVSLSPTPADQPVSDSYGMGIPAWPTRWVGDIHMGRPTLEPYGGGKIGVGVPFLVDHRFGGAAAFPLPIAADVSLFQVIPKVGKQLLAQWYTGGIAPAHYQGAIVGAAYPIEANSLSIGSIYQIEALFEDPKDTFDLLRYAQRSAPDGIPPIVGQPGKDTLPTLPQFTMVQPVPKLLGVPPIGGDIERVYKASMQEFRIYTGFQFWPPYYTAMCSSADPASCKPAARRALLKLTARFTLIKSDPNGSYDYKHIQLKRESSVMTSYDKGTTTFPAVRCE